MTETKARKKARSHSRTNAIAADADERGPVTLIASVPEPKFTEWKPPRRKTGETEDQYLDRSLASLLRGPE